MAITPATLAEFEAYLTERNKTPSEDKAVLLIESLDFLENIPLCSEGSTIKAQCAIAYAMSEKGGGFDPFGVKDSRVLVKEGIGRGASVEEYSVDTELSGTDSLSQLKTVPAAYNALRPLLCSNGSSGVGNFELMR